MTQQESHQGTGTFTLSSVHNWSLQRRQPRANSMRAVSTSSGVLSLTPTVHIFSASDARRISIKLLSDAKSVCLARCYNFHECTLRSAGIASLTYACNKAAGSNSSYSSSCKNNIMADLSSRVGFGGRIFDVADLSGSLALVIFVRQC